MEWETEHWLPFLNILIDNNHSPAITTVYCKKTFTSLLINYFSFTPRPYEIGLVRTLVDRVYKINNSWSGFHEDIKRLFFILLNCFPINLIEKVVNQYITKTHAAQSSKDRQINSSDRPSESATHFYKLPYIGPFSNVTQNRIRQLVNRYYNNLHIKLVFVFLQNPFFGQCQRFYLMRAPFVRCLQIFVH